jgi:hypothetical protein
MTTSLNTLINETILLGEKLKFDDLNDSLFEKYQCNIKLIIQSKNNDNELHIKVLESIKRSKLDNFKINLISKIFYFIKAESMYNGLYLIKNTKKHICIRYIFNINEKLYNLLD